MLGDGNLCKEKKKAGARVKTKGRKGNKESDRKRNQGQNSNRATSKNIGSETNNVKKTSLKALYLNVWSIYNKVHELITYTDVNGCDIMGITETGLQGDQGWELNVPGYSEFRKDRHKKKRWWSGAAD